DCNVNEVPVGKVGAAAEWKEHFASLEKYAGSPHMLMLNGCDHQPIQTDLSEVLKTAEALYPDVTFKHSNFNEYIASLSETLPADLKTEEGELSRQRTKGWRTRVNTVSTRSYLKQMKRTGERLISKVAEPLV